MRKDKEDKGKDTEPPNKAKQKAKKTKDRRPSSDHTVETTSTRSSIG